MVHTGAIVAARVTRAQVEQVACARAATRCKSDALAPQYRKYFDSADTDKAGYLSGAAARAFFVQVRAALAACHRCCLYGTFFVRGANCILTANVLFVCAGWSPAGALVVGCLEHAFCFFCAALSIGNRVACLLMFLAECGK